MNESILNKDVFCDLMQKHCYEVLNTLINENTEFSIVVNTKYVSFDPILPEELDISKNPYTLFALGGYTFTSIKLDKNSITFHAGFGPDDFATFVNVDLKAITQIQIENSVLFVNFSVYKRKKENMMEKSMNVFLNTQKKDT